MKIKNNKNFSKKPLFPRNQLVSVQRPTLIAWYFGAVLAFIISACFLASLSFGQELLLNTPGSSQSGNKKDLPGMKGGVPIPEPKKVLERIIDMNGVVGIDGSLRVLEANYTKVFDLVETSTPVVAGSNHARLFLRTDGTKQSLVIGWDDGTYTRIAGN